MQVVGAGLGRTGTLSLKTALEHLLDGPCYHMLEVFGHPEHVAMWHAAIRGEDVDWDALFQGYKAAVDWPEAGHWREISDHFPDALVLLSTRDSEGWWRSANNTIFEVFRATQKGEPDEWAAMATDMLKRFCPDFLDHDAAIAAYEAHNASVRAEVPAERLIDWQPGNGWQPLCDALGVPVPDIDFPHVNSTEEFRNMAGLT
jgi:sulfotransferase family protein